MKFYFISPIGQKSYLLFDTFEETFKANGHEIANNIEDATHVFYDIWCGFGSYDSEVIRKVNDKPVYVFDFHDYNETTVWPGFRNWEHLQYEEWAFHLKNFVGNGNVKAYFMRKISKTLTYPEWVHPIECIQYPDHDFPLTTPDELFSRPNDVCFIGTHSKERESVIIGLVSEGIKVDCQFTTERISHDEWLQRHRQAKFFLTADGGGYSDERAYQLITIAPMLKQNNSHFVKHPFVGTSHCMRVDKVPAVWDIRVLKETLTNKEALYKIYENGIHHMKKYYSAEARANYILTTIENNL